MKKCANPNCKKKNINEFYHDRTRYDRRSQYCKECVKIRTKERYQKNPNKNKQYNKLYYQKCKQETMSHYGTICQCCGESHIEFLTLDHIEQNGAEYRKNMASSHTCTGYYFYLWLRRNNYPQNLGLQVLCANCNTAKGACNKCPHIAEKLLNNFIDGSGI